jgi:hypothetical protein
MTAMHRESLHCSSDARLQPRVAPVAVRPSQATAKGKGKVGNSAFRDLWMPALWLFVNGITLAVAIVQSAFGALLISPLAISILWTAYNMIPQVCVRIDVTGFLGGGV